MSQNMISEDFLKLATTEDGCLFLGIGTIKIYNFHSRGII